MGGEWNGEERRKYCRQQHLDLKEWASTQICMATKGSKIWNKIMRPIIMLLLSVAIAGQFWSHSRADDSRTAAERNATKIENVGKIVDEHHDDIKDIKEDIGEINQNITRILTILENEVE